MIMKRVFKSLFVIVASMVTFAGCQKEENNAPAAGETKTVQFFANSIETKTAFGTPDGKTYPTLWTENDEQVKILLNLNEEAVADVEISDDCTTASFIADVELGKTNPSVSPYQFAVISPATAYLGKTDARFAVTIPTTQTPLVNSVDEAAQILYAVSESYEQIPGSVNLVFKHFTAYGNLSFTNLNLGDAVVQSVAITSSVGFANRWNYFPGTGVFEPNSAASTITLSTSNTENLWFACAPVGDMNGKELTFTINTNKGPLSKTVTLSGDNYKFEAGKIAKMTVNMAGIEFAKSKVYELVTSADDLTPESEIIIVATVYDKALSTTQNSNNRAQAAITKSSDKSTITDPGNDVQVLIVGEGSTDGTISLSTGEKYLYAPGGGNYLRETTTLNENASWTVSITDVGVATIKANRSDRNCIRYNSGNNPPIFSCYTSGQTDVAIYKLQGTGTAPLPKLTAPTVTAELNEDETGIDVSWGAVASATSYVIAGVGDDVITTDTSYSFAELEPGTYNITVKAIAEGYKSATSGAVSVVVPNPESGDSGESPSESVVLLDENFSTLTSWSTTDVSSLTVNDKIWTRNSGKMYAQNGCIKFGSGTAAINTGVKLPKLTSISGTANVRLTFKAVSSAGAYAITVASTTGSVGTLAPASITKYSTAINNGAQTSSALSAAFAASTEFSVDITGVTSATDITIKVTARAKQWYIDDVKVVTID